MSRFSTLLLSLLAPLFLAGCFASVPLYTDAQGNRAGGTGTAENQRDLTILGAATGALILRKDPVAGALIGGSLGAMTGRKMDQAADARGTTTCNYGASKSGTDRNGAYNQTASSQKTVPGYKADCN